MGIFHEGAFVKNGHTGLFQHRAIGARNPLNFLILVGDQRRPVKTRRINRPAIAPRIFGMHPRITQVPPKPFCSAMATRAPICADTRAPRTPPDPAPTTNRSKSYL